MNSLFKTHSVRQCMWIHATLGNHQKNVHKLEAGTVYGDLISNSKIVV